MWSGCSSVSNPSGALTKSSLKKRFWIGASGAALVAVIAFHSAILGLMGDYLVQAGPPSKADIILVLGGDPSGNRIITAAQLVREGYAPRVLVSGPAGNYGYYESELEIPFAEKRGYPASYFVAAPNTARSTREEARDMAPELRRLGAKTVLLVTSDYHTRRAAGIFRAEAPDLTFYVVAAPDEHFSPHAWWRDREGRKVFAFESIKTVTEWFGL